MAATEHAAYADGHLFAAFGQSRAEVFDCALSPQQVLQELPLVGDGVVGGRLFGRGCQSDESGGVDVHAVLFQHLQHAGLVLLKEVQERGAFTGSGYAAVLSLSQWISPELGFERVIEMIGDPNV